jgi:3-hydroxyisobutyrate dehydrogenase-like beta-hydroxyacid dehydrogenase
MDSIGVVGLGIMGMAYARNLLGAGMAVSGFDVDEDRLRMLGELGGQPAGSAAEVATGAEIVLVALPSAPSLHSAVDGPGGLTGGSRPGLVVVEMSTLPISDKEWARVALSSAGAIVIDAPVSGTGLQAETADLVVYASGDSAAIDRARPVFAVIAGSVYDLGEFGNGSKMKFVANLLVSVHNLATAEAFVLGMRGGLDPHQILEVISAGVGSSRIFEIRGPMIVADDYPPAARIQMFLKDIDVIGEFGRSVGAPTPMLDASLSWYREAVERGLGDLDAAALARLLMERAGPDF